MLRDGLLRAITTNHGNLLPQTGIKTLTSFVIYLTEFNQKWAYKASLLGFIVARKHFEHNGKPNQLAVFDCGAAWLAMTLQARQLGLYTHGMGGIKREEIYKAFDLEPCRIRSDLRLCIRLYRLGKSLARRSRGNRKPSARKPLEQIWQRGA